jgi:hypothetical protein
VLWFANLFSLTRYFPGVYTIRRSDDPPGRAYFTFTAANDHEACQTARKVMKGQGSAEVWSGTRLVDII